MPPIRTARVPPSSPTSKLAGRTEPGTVIHLPRIGCGLAGGTWDQIEPLLDEHLVKAGFDVQVYDLAST